MTRARARALETEVTSLLARLPFDSHETWLLPQTEMLCILRYQGLHREEAREQGEPEAEDIREDGDSAGGGAGPDVRLAVRTSGQGPDDPGRGPDDAASGLSFGSLRLI